MSRQRKNGKWEVRWRVGGRHRSRSFDLKADAVDFEAEVRRTRQRGGMIRTPREVPTLRDFALDWLARRDVELAPSTVKLNAGTLAKHILPGLGGYRLTELRPLLLRDWEATAGSHGLLKQMLNEAVALELIESNPLDAIKRPTQLKRPRRAISAERVEAIREYFLAKGDTGAATLVSVMAYVGVRPPQEATALRWEDWDGDLRVSRRNAYGTIVEATKTGEARTISLPEPVRADLAAWKLATPHSEGLIFPRRDGSLWTKTAWDNWRRRHFDKATEAAGVKADPYSLRHTSVSLMLSAGRPLSEVAAHHGHSVRTLTEVYAHEIEAMRGTEVVPVERTILAARKKIGSGNQLRSVG